MNRHLLFILLTFTSAPYLGAAKEYPPHSPMFTEDHVSGSKELLKKVMKAFPPEQSIVIFSGALSAIHSIVARQVLGDSHTGYIWHHPLQDFHFITQEAGAAYFQMLVKMSEEHRKKIVLIRQMDQGGVISHMAFAIAKLRIPDIKSHLVLAGVHSATTRHWDIHLQIQYSSHDESVFTPDFVDFSQPEFLDYSAKGHYDDLHHPSHYTSELPISYNDWFRTYGMKIPLRESGCPSIWK